MSKVMSFLPKIFPHLLAVGIFVIAFLIYDRVSDKAIEEVKIDFPLLTYEQPIAAKVKEIYCPPELRCAGPRVFVILDSKVKKTIKAKESIDQSTILIEF